MQPAKQEDGSWNVLNCPNEMEEMLTDVPLTLSIKGLAPLWGFNMPRLPRYVEKLSIMVRWSKENLFLLTLWCSFKALWGSLKPWGFICTSRLIQKNLLKLSSNNPQISVTLHCWNKVLWLDVACHMTSFNQWECLNWPIIRQDIWPKRQFSLKLCRWFDLKLG